MSELKTELLRCLMRIELNALLELLIKKGVFTQEEFETQMIEEADHLSAEYE